jgi:hypothetical protein
MKVTIGELMDTINKVLNDPDNPFDMGPDTEVVVSRGIFHPDSPEGKFQVLMVAPYQGKLHLVVSKLH